MRLIRRRHASGDAGAAEEMPDLEGARRQAEESARQAHADLAAERRKLAEGETLVGMIRRLHERNHVAEDISQLIRRGYGEG